MLLDILSFMSIVEMHMKIIREITVQKRDRDQNAHRTNQDRWIHKHQIKGMD
jgi:hypothetical protein